jgi:hypothetical protein
MLSKSTVMAVFAICAVVLGVTTWKNSILCTESLTFFHSV